MSLVYMIEMGVVIMFILAVLLSFAIQFIFWR